MALPPLNWPPAPGILYALLWPPPVSTRLVNFSQVRVEKIERQVWFSHQNITMYSVEKAPPGQGLEVGDSLSCGSAAQPTT